MDNDKRYNTGVIRVLEGEEEEVRAEKFFKK